MADIDIKVKRDGEDCLTPEQDELLRKPLKEYGSKDVEVSIKFEANR